MVLKVSLERIQSTRVGACSCFYTMGLNTSEGKSVNDSRPPVLIVAEFYYSV